MRTEQTETKKSAKTERVKYEEMSTRELRERVRKLQVKPADAGEDLAKFLKRVSSLASKHTEKQLLKLGEKKEVKFVYGRGRQTEEAKRQKMAAQILLS